MERTTRRTVLGGLAAVLAGSSGCAGDGGGNRTETATATERSFERTIPSPTARTVRNSAGEPSVRSSDFTPPGEWEREEWVVSSESDRDALQFSPDATDRDAATRFVDGMDLTEHSVLVDQYRVRTCAKRALERLEWGPDPDAPPGYYSVELTYTRTETDDDCPDDGPYDVAAHLIRVPAEIEALNSVGALVS